MTNSSVPVTVRLTRATGQQWGFRLHGGKDFNQPLIILKVSGGSIAEQSNLSAGDVILSINGSDTTLMRHKDAQDLIARSGNTVEFLVQKCATSTWKPSVTPVGDLQVGARGGLVTQTSLAKNQPSSGLRFGPGVNSAAKPFLVKDGRAVVNNQFNTPINLYSEANIAEALSAQAEVLAGGAIGVNFKKNEKKYNFEESEVYKMLKQVENEPEDAGVPEDRPRAEAEKVPPPQLTQTINQLRPVRAPEPKPKSAEAQQGGGSQAGGNPNLCADCERLIVGVFVRIKDKNLHVECFKCATCGQSLKNIGYFNINNKLYCDVHAQTVARNNPPAPGLEPFATLPGIPAGTGSISAPTSLPPSMTSIPMPDMEPKTSIASVPPSTAGDANAFGTPSSFFNSGSVPSANPVMLANADTTTNSTCWSASGSVPVAPAPAPSTCSESLIKSTAVENLTVDTALEKFDNLTISTSEQQQQQQFNKFSPGPRSPKLDPYAANIAPQPFHHSPTAPHHVQAPTKTFKESSFMEKKTFSSETVTKTGPGSKFVWPPLQSNDDQVTIGGDVPASQGHIIPIERQQSLQQQQNFSSQMSSSFSTQQGLDSSFNTSSFNQPASSLYQNQPPTQPYKPVVPPKPVRAPQVPYKPLSTLLAPASKAPAPAPAAPSVQTIPFQSIPASFSAAPPAPAPSSMTNLGNALGNLNLKKGQNVSRGVMPNRGRGVLNQPGPRLAVCGSCQRQIRGPFISAMGSKFYCPEHFKCATPNCGRGLMDIGFVEERGHLYCEFCWESYLAPVCAKCNKRVKNECLNALGQQFHPSCFTCSHCHVCFGNNPFYLEDGRPFCEKDWNELFTTKCYGCGYPIEAGDRWVEALNQNYHSQCFNCSACKKNLEGQSFFAKGGRPFCKSHAR